MLYILNQRFPTDKAYGIQVSKMCEAFSNVGVGLELVVPYRVNSDDDVFDYYSIKRNFKVTKLYSPDFYLPGRFDRISFWIKSIVSALVLCSYAMRSKPDLVYSRDELPIYFLSFLTKKRLVFEAHGYSSSRSIFYSRFKNRDVKVVAITNGIRKKMISFGFKPANVLVAHDGVDLDEFKKSVDATMIKRRYHLPDDRPIILYAGQLYYRKGADLLIGVARECPDAVVVIAGGSSEEVGDFKKKFGGVDNLVMLGRLDHQGVLTLMSAADVLILPNREESDCTSPLKLFEYMASGKPIISSSIESIREVLDNNNSILAAPNDHGAIVNAITRLLSDENLAKSIATQARKDVESYTWLARASVIQKFL